MSVLSIVRGGKAPTDSVAGQLCDSIAKLAANVEHPVTGYALVAFTRRGAGMCAMCSGDTGLPDDLFANAVMDALASAFGEVVG